MPALRKPWRHPARVSPANRVMRCDKFRSGRGLPVASEGLPEGVGQGDTGQLDAEKDVARLGGRLEPDLWAFMAVEPLPHRTEYIGKLEAANVKSNPHSVVSPKSSSLE